MKCACGTAVSGAFRWARLARLSQEDQQLIELFILAGGSLKDLALALHVSYPTIRKRLNGVIERLRVEVHSDEERRKALLKDVVEGKRSAEDATKQMGST